MAQLNQNRILNLLSESAHEAADLYVDSPLDYKGRPISARVIQDLGLNLHFVDIVKLVLDEFSGAKILDVGIAYGLYDVVLKRILNADIHGIEHPANLECYCRYPLEKGIPVMACDVQAQSLPYSDNFFDMIIASEIVEHLIMPPKAFFRKLYRVLKPGGKLIVTTPNFASLLNIIQIMRGNNPSAAFPETDSANGQPMPDLRVHPREYTPKEIAADLVGTGFQISAIRTVRQVVGDGKNWRLNLLNLLTRLVPRHRDKIIAVGLKRHTIGPEQR